MKMLVVRRIFKEEGQNKWSHNPRSLTLRVDSFSEALKQLYYLSSTSVKDNANGILKAG